MKHRHDIPDSPRARGSSTRRGIFGQNSYQPLARAELWRYQEVVPPDPSDSGFLGHVFVGNMGKLFFPIYDLGCGNWQRLPSAALDKIYSFERQFIEQNIDPLIMKKIELGRTGYHVFQNPIGEMKDHGNSPVQALDDRGREGKMSFPKVRCPRHAKKGGSLPEGIILSVLHNSRFQDPFVISHPPRKWL